MNKKQYLSALFSLCATLSFSAPHVDPLYTFEIEFPQAYRAKPTLAARCKGERISLYNGLCTLPHGAVEDIFYIIITEHIEFSCKKNKSIILKKPAHTACKYYRILRNSTAAFNKKQQPWIIWEVPLDEQSEILPENSPIIFLNPSFIKELKIGANKGIKTKPIPTLVIAQNIPEDSLTESINMCALTLPDTNMFHKPQISHKEWSECHLKEWKL